MFFCFMNSVYWEGALAKSIPIYPSRLWQPFNSTGNITPWLAITRLDILPTQGNSNLKMDTSQVETFFNLFSFEALQPTCPKNTTTVNVIVRSILYTLPPRRTGRHGNIKQNIHPCYPPNHSFRLVLPSAQQITIPIHQARRLYDFPYLTMNHAFNANVNASFLVRMGKLWSCIRG